MFCMKKSQVLRTYFSFYSFLSREGEYIKNMQNGQKVNDVKTLSPKKHAKKHAMLHNKTCNAAFEVPRICLGAGEAGDLDRPGGRVRSPA